MIETLEKGITLTTQVITLLIATGALLISLIQTRRGRRQTNEDIIFHQKLQAYRDLIKSTYDFLDQSFSLLDELADFEGTKEEWVQTKMPEFLEISIL